MRIDEKKIAFITCVNNEEEYDECKYYLGRLNVPEGYEIDIRAVRGASSMAEGYNAGMRSSDAKFKVYLHQDVFIINVDFIADLLAVFAQDEQIGLLGVIGWKEKAKDIFQMGAWDTGKTIDNRWVYKGRLPMEKNSFLEVWAVDGLLMATQYDILWRGDVFDGWDFYDFSQCMEFLAKGYKVAVPYQSGTGWCIHNNFSPSLIKYFDYGSLFFQEYSAREWFPVADIHIDKTASGRRKDEGIMIAEGQKEIKALITLGEKSILREFFKIPEVRAVYGFRECKMIVDIDWQEEQNQSKLRLWEEKENGEMPSYSDVVSKLRNLRYKLIRIQYGADTEGWEKNEIENNYSEYAVNVVVQDILSIK